jgi:hypothetical protein
MSESTAERDIAAPNGIAKPGPPPPPWKDDSDVLYVGEFHKEVQRDWWYVMSHEACEEWVQYRGKSIVVVNQQIIAVGDDHLALEQEVCDRTGLPPGRLVITTVNPDRGWL